MADFEKPPDRLPLVELGQLQFERGMGSQHRNPCLRRRSEEPLEPCFERTFGPRSLAVVHGVAVTFVFSEGSGKVGQDLGKLRPERRRQRADRFRDSGLALRVEPEFGAVDAARRKSQRREQTVEVGERSSADERERAAGRRLGAFQVRDQPLRHDDRIGALGDVDERSVDIEKEGDLGRLDAHPQGCVDAGHLEHCSQISPPVRSRPSLSTLRGGSVFQLWPASPLRARRGCDNRLAMQWLASDRRIKNPASQRLSA